MDVLSELEPKEVFRYFEEICQIPHPSYREEKISDYCVRFAKEHHLEVYQDDLKNVMIMKEATEGYEQEEPLILQGHLDMVCEKEASCGIDFEKDGLTLWVDGDYVRAKGTTLGGDDGIAVAYALAILASDTISHPRLEVIFTVAEEVGMEGASALDVSLLTGRRLLNLDSEEEGHLLAGCAGGRGVECMLPAAWEQKRGVVIEVVVSGLLGGHSGMEIDKGRANANILLARVLMDIGKISKYGIISMSGGNKDNAIPRKAHARILVDGENVEKITAQVGDLAGVIAAEYATSDPGICIQADVAEEETVSVLTEETVQKAVLLIAFLPNGVQRMSADISGLVETSLNLGVLHLSKEKLSLHYALRSSVETAKALLSDQLEALTVYMGGNVYISGDYPAWEYKRESVFRGELVRIYREMYGQQPVVETIHAGMECGILAGKIAGLDAVSIGPDILDIHTTEEKLSISSTKRVWEYILEILKTKN